MTGADVLLQTLAANGVDTCFMNPGTSEMHFVAALDRTPEVRGILCLFEGVCAGAADGYGRMTGRPAATLLHLGPGLGNALANLHNARKARTPVVNIVGEHSTRHLQYDAPLSADIEAFARTVSGHVRTVREAADVGTAAAEAIVASFGPPGQVATLIVPADLSWSEEGGELRKIVPPGKRAVCAARIRDAAQLMRESGTAVLLGGTSTNERALTAAGRLQAHTGVRILADRNAPKIAAGGGRFQPVTVPYFPEPALALLAEVKAAILVETQAPVSFFGYPNTPSYLLPENCRVAVLAERGEDGTAALEALVDECGAGATAIPVQARLADGLPSGPLTPDAIGRVLAARLPEGAILADEMVSATIAVVQHLPGAKAHERLPVTGGSIGQGLPVAVGAACACRDRKVVALEADGSGMYTPQALWTMARQELDVVTVVFANRRYQILDIEMRRTGAQGFGKAANDAIDIGRPELDWVRLATGMGVPATRARTGEEFDREFRVAMEERGPRLIEAWL